MSSTNATVVPTSLRANGACREEAIEGVDHTAVIDIPPADSLETRVVHMLEHLVAMNPAGDWGYFLDGARPRWSSIVISGISHGASSAGVVGMIRSVSRVVMLSGPLDSNQAWLRGVPLTPIDRFYGFTHTADDQHAGHLAAFEAMGLLGTPVDVDTVAAPYVGSHRLKSSLPTSDGHGSTQAGGLRRRIAGCTGSSRCGALAARRSELLRFAEDLRIRR